jgi:membrane protein DedA with SNARE-associated domain
MIDWLRSLGDLFTWMAASIMRFAADYTYGAILAVLFVEEAGVPLPVPGDTIILYAGYRVSLGKINPILAGLCVVAATVAGSTILYWVARLGGHQLVFKYGRYVHLDPPRLERMERWFQQHQRSAIILGRLVPGLRTAVTVAAGIFEVPYPAFVLYTALSSVIWAAFYLTAGAVLGREYDQLAAYIIYLVAQPPVQVALLLAVPLIIFWRRRAWRRRRVKRAPARLRRGKRRGEGDSERPSDLAPAVGEHDRS